MTRRIRRYAYRTAPHQVVTATAKDGGRAPRQILVVEDDAGSRRALVNVLEDRGYSVVGIGSAIEALDFLADQPIPELIILDLMLPDMEGWDFRHRQKINPAIAGIPVIGVSAVGKLMDVEYSLRKPLDYDEFVRAVEHYVPQPDRRSKSRLKASQPT